LPGGGDSAKWADVPSEDCFGFDLFSRAEDQGVVDLATGQGEVDNKEYLVDDTPVRGKNKGILRY
jgi:hypothetical protein